MMGNTKYFVFAILMMNFCLSFGKVYKIGDSSGWKNGQVNYMSWAAQQNFQVGDTIVFEYNKEYHNVVQVTHNNFNACNTTTPYSTWATGNDTYYIKKPGHFYFICGIPGHCQAGMKVDIRVPKSHVSTPTPPAPSPTQPSPGPIPKSPMPPAPSHIPENPMPQAPSPIPERPLSPTPSFIPESPVSPAPSRITESPMSPTPSPLPKSPVSPAPSAVPESPVSPSPSPITKSPMSPAPSPLPKSPMSPAPSAVRESPVSPAPSPSKADLPATPSPSPSSGMSMHSSLSIWNIVVSFSLRFLVAVWN